MFAHSSFVSRVDTRPRVRCYAYYGSVYLLVVVPAGPSPHQHQNIAPSYCRLVEYVEGEYHPIRRLWYLNRSRWLNRTPGRRRRVVNDGATRVSYNAHRV